MRLMGNMTSRSFINMVLVGFEASVGVPIFMRLHVKIYLYSKRYCLRFQHLILEVSFCSRDLGPLGFGNVR